MKIYLVGGAVRDKLLGLPMKERDYVVVGATIEEMLAKNFTPIGKEFPVFLHPKTKEEYALARTERKVSKGYKGFEFYADSTVTLEQDLLRRDLTINAMAEDEQGRLIDLYNGQQDLEKQLLHHVSSAFAEDPVRILRVARFASKLPGFKVHPETNDLMKRMVEKGEVDALVAERVWKEFSRALEEAEPWRFFEVLQNCGALAVLFPTILPLNDLKILFQSAKQQSAATEILFALIWPLGSEEALAQYNRRYKLPKKFCEFARLFLQHYEKWRTLQSICTAENILALLIGLDVFRRADRFAHFLLAATVKSDTPCEPLNAVLMQAEKACAVIDNQKLLSAGYEGKAFADALYEARRQAIARIL